MPLVQRLEGRRVAAALGDQVGQVARQALVVVGGLLAHPHGLVALGPDLVVLGRQVPVGLALLLEVAAQRLVVHAAKDTETRKREVAKLADLEQRLAIEEEARQTFYRTS